MSWDSSKNESLPSYAELKARSDAPAGSAWGLFGTDDQIGTVNLLTEDAAVQAAALVRRGASFGLGLALQKNPRPLRGLSARRASA